MNKKEFEYLNQILGYLSSGLIKKATKFIDKNKVMRVVLHKDTFDKRNKIFKVILTVGKPNYMERDFIKDCVKANEPFPVKQIQIKAYKAKK